MPDTNQRSVTLKHLPRQLLRRMPNGLRNRLATQPILRLVGTCWQHAGERRPRYLLFVLMSCLAQVALLAKPYFFGKSFDAIQLGGPHIIDNVLVWMLPYGLMSLLFWSLHGPARIMERTLAFGIRRRFFAYHYRHIRKLPLKWHQDHHAGEVINRTRKATDALFDFAQNQFGLIGIFFSLAGPIVILFGLSWPIALVALAVNSCILLVLRSFDKSIMAWINRENEKEHHFSSGLLDYIGNMTTVITLRLGRRTEDELNTRLHEIYRQFKHHVTLGEAKYFLMDITISALEVAIILLYIHQQLSATGTVLIGSTIIIFRYLNTLSSACFQFAGVYQNVQRQYTDLKALDPIRRAENRFARTTPENPGFSWHRLDISNLTYTHTNDEAGESSANRIGIRNLSLTIRRGQRIALVGESGSGKSTLLAVLRGLYPADTITLLADGQPHHPDILRDITTLIPQQPEIFDNTATYNIAVGLEHTAEDLARVIYLSRFESVLQRLPHGLETPVRAKGVHLSGGEKQRLALARGLFAGRESSLLLLDEPTSSVDPTTEGAIYDAIFHAYPEKAVISSIHRLNMVEKFDTILVMQAGEIVQSGPLSEVTMHEPFRSQWQSYHRIFGS